MGSDELITGFEIFRFEWHLLFDIRSDKDILKIHPLSLSLNPLLNNFHYELNFQGEFFGSGSDGFNVSVGKCIVDIRKSLV
jgi:hypothetical protein